MANILNPRIANGSTILGFFAFASRPAANVCKGYSFYASDLNNAEFYSDGTNWRPRGQQDIYHKNSLLSVPLATLTGVTSGIFATPALSIPAGLLIPNSKITVQLNARKTGANGTAMLTAYIGTTGSMADSVLSSLNLAITTLTDGVSCVAAKFGTATNKFNTQIWIGEGSSGGSGQLVLSDRNTNINTAAAMTLSIAISSANASDSFALISYRVVLEA